MAGNVSMSMRKKDSDGLDFYPTPPWVTRAFVDMVRPQGVIWEPACGGGHMSAVLAETNDVVSTDVVDRGFSGQSFTFDFEDVAAPKILADWIVTNPPFKKEKSQKFARIALGRAPGVAILGRLSWLEGEKRYRYLFEENPPSLVAVFSERMGFIEEGCDVDRGGMLPYSWYVWEPGVDETRLTWFPPGTRNRLSRHNDAERFNKRVVSL